MAAVFRSRWLENFSTRPIGGPSKPPKGAFEGFGGAGEARVREDPLGDSELPICAGPDGHLDAAELADLRRRLHEAAQRAWADVHLSTSRGG